MTGAAVLASVPHRDEPRFDHPAGPAESLPHPEPAGRASRSAVQRECGGREADRRGAVAAEPVDEPQPGQQRSRRQLHERHVRDSRAARQIAAEDQRESAVPDWAGRQAAAGCRTIVTAGRPRCCSAASTIGITYTAPRCSAMTGWQFLCAVAKSGPSARYLNLDRVRTASVGDARV